MAQREASPARAPGRALAAAAACAAILLGASASQSAPAQNGRAAPKKAQESSCDRANFRVIVDVGHSAEVPGATSARGVPEYDYNLGLATQIERSLQRAGFGKAHLLVTPGPARRGLFGRVAKANSIAGDLFISVHHDSVPERFIDVWEYGGKRQRYSDRFRGHSIFISYENPAVQPSFQFAQLLGTELKATGLQYTPHYSYPIMQERRRDLLDEKVGVYRFDHLIVLKETRMPAVLLEAGSIVHRQEEQEMATPERRATIAGAVVKAVERFCGALTQQEPRQERAERPVPAQPVAASPAPAKAESWLSFRPATTIPGQP
ncbi:MAG: N-acetylmuramoyl-L-alanine amidase [Microvirga sp.]|jgi:N-acetylmuramoyl-L-alanine amidase|nr:N-acetylmuramoyl-L-alanine amidase [Microvirga sp.]